MRIIGVLAGRNGRAITRRFTRAATGGRSMLVTSVVISAGVERYAMSITIQLAVGAIALATTLTSPRQAAAWFPGFPPQPSNCAQWWGYGYGPGHQAPMVKTRDAASERGPRYVYVPRGCELPYPAPYAPIGCYGGAGGCGCGANQGEAGYLPGAGPMVYPHAQPAMAPPPAAAQRDDSLTWR